MFQAIRGPLAVVGRVLLCTIFFMAAVGNKIPHFSDVAKVMESVGVPAPQFLLVGAIVLPQSERELAFAGVSGNTLAEE